jgi:hypothetical protein
MSFASRTDGEAAPRSASSESDIDAVRPASFIASLCAGVVLSLMAARQRVCTGFLPIDLVHPLLRVAFLWRRRRLGLSSSADKGAMTGSALCVGRRLDQNIDHD